MQRGESHRTVAIGIKRYPRTKLWKSRDFYQVLGDVQQRLYAEGIALSVIGMTPIIIELAERFALECSRYATLLSIYPADTCRFQEIEAVGNCWSILKQNFMEGWKFFAPAIAQKPPR